MFIRKKTRRYQPRRPGPDGTRAPERIYVSYAIVESYRDEFGQPRQRSVMELGPDSSLEPRLARARERIERLRARERAAESERMAARHRHTLTLAEGALARLEKIERALQGSPHHPQPPPTGDRR